MKHLLYFSLIVFLLINKLGFSQNNEFVKELNASIYTSFPQKSWAKMKTFINENNPEIIKQTEATSKYYVQFYLKKNAFDKLNQMLPEFGFVSNKEIKTSNYQEDIDRIEIEKKHLNEKKLAYEKEINTMSEKNDRYYRYWEEVRAIDKKIHQLNKELVAFKRKNYYKTSITIYDESYDMTQRTINWVNMPGASADFLVVESPISSQSAKQYLGYQLKYMFTRGKSYANLGAFKEFSEEVEDLNRFKELFFFGFGQDFYSKYFGRGKNKFFNLYTGYNIGGIFATGENKKATFMYLTPYFGIELFKNKYFLLDTRVGYFVPFKYNRNMRGITYNISFNFAF